jgi:hypothetical protein
MPFYCYGVTAGNVLEHVVVGIQGHENKSTFVIRFKDLQAVISEVSEENFSQEAVSRNVKSMQWLVSNAPVHERVVDQVRAKTTIIPMTFCTIFTTEKNVESMLEEKYAVLKENLSRLQDMAEISVKVYADKKVLQEEACRTTPRIQALKKEKEGKTPGAAYFVEQKIQVLVQEQVRKRLADSTRAIFEALKVHALSAKQTPLLKEKGIVLHGAFLMSSEETTSFTQGVSALQKAFPLLQIHVAGPFTPYHFVR